MKAVLLFASGLAVAVLATGRLPFFQKKEAQLVENQSVMSLSPKGGGPENPVELGRVHWLRDFDEAKKTALADGKPMLVLFQEVPGCATCTRYGNAVLSHPLLVEAVEAFFTPVCIFNNKGGSDRRTLEHFGEPAWNNPVVRILSATTEADLVPRISGNYSPQGLASGIAAALEKTGQAVPLWLVLLEKSLRAEQTGIEEAVFSMGCFWSGEGKLGGIEGVVSTEPGFMGGREVVRVGFDPAEISFEELVKKGRESGCASSIFCKNGGEKAAVEAVAGPGAAVDRGSFRPDREPKYYLAQTHWRFVPMTEMQASRANSLIGQGLSPAAVLSPGQVELAAFIEKNPKKGWKTAISAADLIKSWAEAEALCKGN